MAVDKLVDSTKLDACLDAEADAIRAKTGGSADIPFDFANSKGFADAIAAIPSGGGGGGISGVTVLQDITLAEPVRSVQYDIPLGYDSAYILIFGEFASSNWLYWKINNSTEFYQMETVSIGETFLLSHRNEKAYLTGMRHSGELYTHGVTIADGITVYFRGYSADFKAGTRILILGGKYADL